MVEGKGGWGLRLIMIEIMFDILQKKIQVFYDVTIQISGSLYSTSKHVFQNTPKGL
jgi:hypothetical protein